MRDDDLDDDGDDGYNGYSDDENDDDALTGIVVQRLHNAHLHNNRMRIMSISETGCAGYMSF